MTQADAVAEIKAPANRSELSVVSAGLEPERQGRVDLFGEIHIDVLPKLPIQTIHSLADAQSVSEAQESLLAQFDGDKEKLIAHLLPIIENPDMVDIGAMLEADSMADPHDKEELMEYIGQWKAFAIECLQNPEKPVPRNVASHPEFIEYRASVDSIRPWRHELASRMYEFCLTDPNWIQGVFQMTMDSHLLRDISDPALRAITMGSRLALALAKGDSKREQAVVASVGKALRAQEKWWVMGLDTDALSTRLLSELRDAHTPSSPALIMDILFHKASLDPDMVYNGLYASEAQQLNVGIGVERTLDAYTSAAAAIDPAETARYVGRYLTHRGIESHVADYLAVRNDLEPLVYEAHNPSDIEYFGAHFHLTDLPIDMQVTLEEATYGVLVAKNPSGKTIAVYNTNIREYPSHQNVHTIRQARLEDMAWWGIAQGPIEKETQTAFFNELPALKQYIKTRSPLQVSDRQFSLASYFSLWNYRRDLPAQEHERIDTFIQSYGPGAVNTFLAGTYGKEDLSRIINFALGTRVPTSRIVEEIPGITLEVHRIGSSPTERLIHEYNGLVYDAWVYAAAITPIREQQIAVRDLILTRAKALLVAGAHWWEEKGALSEAEEQFLEMGFHFHRIFLNALSDSSGSYAREISLDDRFVREFFSFHDPSIPESFAVFQSAMEAGYQVFAAKQDQTASYVHDVPRITEEFYAQYARIASDVTRTTVDPSMEQPRFRASLSHDWETGVLPKHATREHPVAICFTGFGEGRSELPLIEFIQAQTSGYEFIGTDLRLPNDPIAGVQLEQASLHDLGRLFPKKIHRMYFNGSPFMDVLRLKDWQQAVESIANAMEIGGIVEIDQAFPYGAHSYEQIIKEYHQVHPSEPLGMFQRSFDVGGGSDDPELIGKPFFSADPQFMLWIFGMMGFEPINVPKDPQALKALCEQTSRDDSWITTGPQLDLDAQAVYQTPVSERNRITYKFKKVREPAREVLFWGASDSGQK